MSVSTAMYSAITGLSAMGTAMSVIGNNIANVNTIGFKSGRANFMDLLSQATSTASGRDQIGRGVQLGSVSEIFSQGSFQNSAQDTDIAIGGEGFFQVKNPMTPETYYTRAGNFSFDSEGRLVNPAGYILQGWLLDNQGNRVGTPDDITVASFNAPPAPSTHAQYVLNLDASSESRTNGVPLSDVWVGSDDTPLDGTAYVYQTSLRIYDDLGNGHDLSIYFDPDDAQENVWDYIVCCDPEVDQRVDGGGDAFAGSAYAGLLLRGTITFDPNSTADRTGGSIAETATAITAEQITDVTPATLGTAVPASSGGVSLVNYNIGGTYTGSGSGNYTFTVATGGDIATDVITLDWTSPSGATGTINVPTGGTATVDGIQIGFTSGGGTDVLAAGDTFSVAVTPQTATWSTTTPNANGYFTVDASFLVDPISGNPISQNIELDLGAKNPGGVGVWVSDNLATTQYAASSTTVFQNQDGYASGYLQSVSIDADGVLTGSYTNGQNQAMYQICLAQFRNQWGLEKMGRNLYMETRQSGQAAINPPGAGGTGTIAPNSLEQSNVDLAEEFVDMIIQQRGFQANSKIITTTDSMLADLIQMKR